MRLDFYLYATHEVATAAPVLSTLRRLGVDAAFVLEPPDRHLAVGSSPDPAAGWRNRPRSRLVRLVDEPTVARLRELVAATGLPLVDACRRDADVAVTTQGTAWLRRYSCARVRLSYGVGLVLDSYGHGAVNRGFDAVLAHGAFSRRAMELRVPGVHVVEVGYPKWAAFRRGELSREDARKALGLAANRPVLAYLPTWAHRASVDAMASVLPRLTGDWDVVVKPHHNSLRFEQARLGALDEFVPDVEPLVRTDLVPYLVAADAVVTDAVSGAFTEALLAGQPVVAISPPEGGRHLHPTAFRCAPVVRSAADAADLLAGGPPETDGAEAAWWVDRMFRDCAGHDDEEAAHALLQVAHRPVRRWARHVHNRARRAASAVVRQTDATWRNAGRAR